MIITCAHKTGDPGVAFIDRINKDNPTPALGEIEATNPCGEQPLLPYEACTLGSINLAKFVTDKSEIDWPALAQTTKLGVRFLDNIIDACHYPVTRTAEIAHANRKIGLGVMGFADCLFMLGIPYDSSEGVAIGGINYEIHQRKRHTGKQRIGRKARVLSQLARQHLEQRKEFEGAKRRDYLRRTDRHNKYHRRLLFRH